LAADEANPAHHFRLNAKEKARQTPGLSKNRLEAKSS